MHHRLWVMANLFLVVFSMVYIWIFSPHDSSAVVVAQLLAQIGLILFLINVNMYFIFLVIRKTTVRKIKVRLAKASRQMMKWHRPIALFATVVILGHASINLYSIGPVMGFAHLKLLSGYASIVMLAITLFAGWLRHNKASGFRRKFHLISALAFTAVFILHMLMTV